MPNPSLPLPATTIQAAWGQDVTTRVVNVYQNAAARDAAIPTPEDGQLAYLLDEDLLTVRIAGVLWIAAGVGTFVQVEGDSMTGNLDMTGNDVVGVTSIETQPAANFGIKDDAGTIRLDIKNSGDSEAGRINLRDKSQGIVFSWIESADILYAFKSLRFDKQLLAPDGSSATPPHSFAASPNTGPYLIAPGDIGYSFAGSVLMRMSQTVFIAAQVYSATTGAAANVNVEPGGQLRLSTSARRYKSNIEAADALAALNLEPVTFHHDGNDADYIGFIADDMPDERAIERDGDGAVAGYDLRAVVAILAAKANSIEARLAALES